MIATYEYYCSECGEGLDDRFGDCPDHPNSSALKRPISSRTAGRDEQDDEEE
jgi:predicted ATP-dependent serine protease